MQPFRILSVSALVVSGQEEARVSVRHVEKVG